jgi:hypothetical protein
MGQMGGSENYEQVAQTEHRSGRSISKQAPPIQLWDESYIGTSEKQSKLIRMKRQSDLRIDGSKTFAIEASTQ